MNPCLKARGRLRSTRLCLSRGSLARWTAHRRAIEFTHPCGVCKCVFACRSRRFTNCDRICAPEGGWRSGSTFRVTFIPLLRRRGSQRRSCQRGARRPSLLGVEMPTAALAARRAQVAPAKPGAHGRRRDAKLTRELLAPSLAGRFPRSAVGTIRRANDRAVEAGSSARSCNVSEAVPVRGRRRPEQSPEGHP